MAETEYAIFKPKYPRQRWLLALDGGGIRGLVTLGILEKLEADLRTASGVGTSFRLSDYFDFIGGTSTGAILAAGLAIGKTVEELLRMLNWPSKRSSWVFWVCWRWRPETFSGPPRDFA
jgi:uncharacterized protein